MKTILVGLWTALASNLAMAMYGVSIDGIDYNLNRESYTAELISYNGPQVVSLYVGKVVYDGQTYTVTSIADYAFAFTYGAQSLRSISLPFVKTIGKGVFASSLQEVSLPSATSMGDDAFCYCSELKEISLPSVSSIGKGAFACCSSLTKVLLPSVISIERQAFYGCSKLEMLSLPNVATIGDGAFDGCSSLMSVSLSEVTSIGENAFYGCGKIETLVVPMMMKNKLEGCRIPKSVAVKYVAIMSPESVIVSTESLAAAKAETVSVENGVVLLGVNVCSNGNFTADAARWGKVSLTSDNVKVVDGKVVIAVPVISRQGFMILQSSEARVNVGE